MKKIYLEEPEGQCLVQQLIERVVLTYVFLVLLDFSFFFPHAYPVEPHGVFVMYPS